MSEFLVQLVLRWSQPDLKYSELKVQHIRENKNHLNFATDPDFKKVCAKCADIVESLKYIVLKLAVLKFLVSVQDTFEMIDAQAATCVLLIATASLRKRADKSKIKAALTLRFLGSAVSVDSDGEMDSRINLIAADKLVGDLTGGDSPNIALSKAPLSFTLRLFIA